jgi:hypothetical protein
VQAQARKGLDFMAVGAGLVLQSHQNQHTMVVGQGGSGAQPHEVTKPGTS